jgi:hypothetical protein
MPTSNFEHPSDRCGKTSMFGVGCLAEAKRSEDWWMHARDLSELDVAPFFQPHATCHLLPVTRQRTLEIMPAGFDAVHCVRRSLLRGIFGPTRNSTCPRHTAATVNEPDEQQVFANQFRWCKLSPWTAFVLPPVIQFCADTVTGARVATSDKFGSPPC